MRITILILILIFAFKSAFCQIPVTDAAANATLSGLNAQISLLNTKTTSNQIANKAEFVQQTSTLINTLNHLKEVKKRLQKVNALLSNVIYYKELVETQLKLIDQQMDYISEVKKDGNITALELSTISSIFSDMLARTQGLLSFATQILTDAKYEMNDYERLEQLKKISDEMSAIFSEFHMAKQSFQYIRKKKDLVSILENW